jgi:enoyl-CoA hydratase/carnithine racemase
VARAKTFGNTVVSSGMVRTTVDGEVRVLTLDRPTRRNALDREALSDLAATVGDATEPVLYLHGEGEAFCAGADLDVVRELDEDGAADFAALGQRVATALEAYDGAVVAGIDGAARGGGVELALACDIRVATPNATLAETGVKLGLFGAWGGTTRLPRVVGEGTALDLALTGRTVDAETALQMGLVSRVTEAPRDVADELAAVDHRALRALKHRIRDETDQQTGDEREQAAFAELATDVEFE